MTHTIDVHTHVMPPRWDDFAAQFGLPQWPAVVHDSTCSTLVLGSKTLRTVTRAAYDPLERLAAMDRYGVAAQLLLPIASSMCYWGPPQATDAFARLQNDYVAELIATYPQRFIGAATVAMQSSVLAIREIERCAALGFRALCVGTNIDGRDLDDPAFFDIFAAAESANLAVFVHPVAPTVGDTVLRAYGLDASLGYAADLARAALHLIFGHVCDRLPTLRVGFAQAAGSLGAVLGRVDHLWKLSSGDGLERPPSEYTRQFFYDALAHEPAVVRALIDRFGVSQLLLGSDFPFEQGIDDPTASLWALDLSPKDRQLIHHDNAQRYLALTNI